MTNPLTTFWQAEDLALVDGGPLPDAPSLAEGPWQILMHRRDAEGHKLDERVEVLESRQLAKQRAREFNTKHSAGDWVATIEPYDALCPGIADIDRYVEHAVVIESDGAIR